MDVLQLVVSAMAGLAAAIPLVVQLVKYVQKAVKLYQYCNISVSLNYRNCLASLPLYTIHLKMRRF